MTYSLTLPSYLSFFSYDLREIILLLLFHLNSDLTQLRSERFETLTALRTERDPELSQLIAEALDAIDFEIDSTRLQVSWLTLFLQ